jgi:hypothetical protein
MEVNSPRSVGSQARRMVGEERSSGKAGEIDDEDEEQDFAAEPQAVRGSPKAVQPKDQPTRNSDRAQDEKRKEKRAVRKKRKEKSGDHIGRSPTAVAVLFILFMEASCVLAGVGALSFERPASDS